MLLFPARGHPDGASREPAFRIEGEHIFPVDGPASKPWYSICNGYVYPTLWHPDGQSSAPWFAVFGNSLYPADGHPDGAGGLPWFESR